MCEYEEKSQGIVYKRKKKYDNNNQLDASEDKDHDIMMGHVFLVSMIYTYSICLHE